MREPGDTLSENLSSATLRQSLRQLEDYKFALDQSSIVAITDARGKITYANNKFCEISKYSRDELVGQDHRIINSGYHPKEFFRIMWASIQTGHVWHGDIRNKAKDGSFYWVATTIVPFLDEHGVPYQYLSIRTEITERKLAEVALERAVRELALSTERERQRAEALLETRDQLREANRRLREEQQKIVTSEKLSSIGLLAAGVAHEINNPLCGIISFAKALGDTTLSEARRSAYSKSMLEGLERIQHIVRGLLEYARQRPAQTSGVDLSEIAGRSVELAGAAAREKGLRIECTFPEDLHALADRSQLIQALLNILLNAVYASPPEGTIRLMGEAAGGMARIHVIDEGEGMSEEIARRACDPFFTTKPEGEGTGLGLAVTLGIARAHHGDLEIHSSEGHGTTVTLTIPLAAPSADLVN